MVPFANLSADLDWTIVPYAVYSYLTIGCIVAERVLIGLDSPSIGRESFSLSILSVGERERERERERE